MPSSHVVYCSATSVFIFILSAILKGTVVKNFWSCVFGESAPAGTLVLRGKLFFVSHNADSDTTDAHIFYYSIFANK
jgi:hypothetical protein